MKIIFLALMTSLGLITTPTSTKNIDVTKSNVEWIGKKITGQHSGTIKLKEGSIELENEKVIGGQFVIDMTSIAVTDIQGGAAEKLAGHLASPDFFDVANHGSAKFDIISVNDEGSVYGNLTIKGITKPISFDADFTSNGATAKIIIDRTKYDIKYGSGSFFDNLGDKAIYDEFTLNVNLVY